MLQGVRWRARICVDKVEHTIGEWLVQQQQQQLIIMERGTHPLTSRPSIPSLLTSNLLSHILRIHHHHTHDAGDYDTEDAAAIAYDRESIRNGKLKTLNFVYRYVLCNGGVDALFSVL